MKLTKLESYVANHFAAGESLEQIATDLNRSVQSIGAALARACRKAA